MFPTYPIILRAPTSRPFNIRPPLTTLTAFKKTTQEVIDFYAAQAATPIPGIPKLDARRVVDGQRLIQFLKPLPTTSEGRNFELRSKVIGVYDKGKPGTVVETEQLIVDKDSGETYCRAVGSGFFVGQGGWGGPKGPATQNFPPPKGKEGKPDAVAEHQWTMESAHLYRWVTLLLVGEGGLTRDRLNGDYNPLHATPEPGQQMGFGGAIMHGLASWNVTAHALLKAMGGSDPANIKEFQARFAAPVKPGDKLTIEMWRTNDVKDGWEEVRFLTKVGSKVVLSNGRALMKVVGGKSKL